MALAGLGARSLLTGLAVALTAIGVLCATAACATETPPASPTPIATPTFTPTLTPTIVPNSTPTPTPIERGDRIPSNAVKMASDLDVYPPQLHSDEWKDPIPLPGSVNTAGAEDSPFVFPDGNTLYFFFTPDVTVPVEKQLLDGVTGIYVSAKEGGVWQEPERVILNDDLALDGCEFVQDDIMWFCSARAGYTGVNWFKARMKGGEWTQWEYAGGEFDPSYEVGELHFSADWNEVYFHSAREGGKGEYDIWVSRKEEGEWQPPVNVEAVNTEVSDGWPFLSHDGRELWFNRWYMGTPALFRSIRTPNGWSEPELIVSTFAGEPTLDEMGNLYFVHHFYKDGEMIEADIYYAERK